MRVTTSGADPGAKIPVPVSIWEVPEYGGRGPRPKHSRAAIAGAAVSVADTEGIDAVTMRRVAAGLGMATMSLYNYVPSKEHLIQLMIDQVSGEYRYAGSPPSSTWPGRDGTSPGATHGCPGSCSGPRLSGPLRCVTSSTSSAC
jgi:hypothetical protein